MDTTNLIIVGGLGIAALYVVAKLLKPPPPPPPDYLGAAFKALPAILGAL